MNYPQSQVVTSTDSYRVQIVFDAFTSNQSTSHSSQVKWFFTFYPLQSHIPFPVRRSHHLLESKD